MYNAPLDVLMCPLQIINDIESLSFTLHGAITCFIHHLLKLENYLIGLNRKPVNQKEKVHQIYIFVHLSAKFWLKIQNTHCYRNFVNFFTFSQFLAQKSKYPLLQKFCKSSVIT